MLSGVEASEIKIVTSTELSHLYIIDSRFRGNDIE